MQPYVVINESIARYAVDHAEDVITTVASRFIGSHPKYSPVYRTYSKRSFHRNSDYRYEMNLQDCWPEMKDGQFVYVWGKLWSEQDAEIAFSISCFSPAKVIVNQTVRFESNLNEDVFPERSAYLRTELHKGWNQIVLEFISTGTGCGGRFGTGSVKGAPLHFLAPTTEREGQEGWIFSEPQNKRWTVFPTEDEEADKMHRWFPEMEWTARELAAGCFGRVVGNKPGNKAFAWSKLDNRSPYPKNVVLTGEHQGICTLLMNGNVVHHTEDKTGSLQIQLHVPFGLHDLVIESTCNGEDCWGFTLDHVSGDEGVKLIPPYPVLGHHDTWLYLGPFTPDRSPKSSDINRIRVDTLFGQGRETTFWRVDQPEMWVRPYLENAMYGRWNYPLGVTLYGILKAGLELSEQHFINYAIDHIEQCTSLHDYSLWDLEQYGAPGTNHQLTQIDSLDDCGSFGAVMLEAHKIRTLNGAKEAAKHIASYITEVQDRLPDGTLYRTRGTVDFMQDTMWCDDLYMSTPFLCKYYELTGDEVYLEDAAKQFLGYKNKLFMPEFQIMHHVYDYKFDRPNGVAWGRGNGWVLFSLTELLAVMPQEYPLRPQILDFFRVLCAGYLKLQGVNGLWHQVLTDPESYEETSCTSMFIYAFARGVRFGWLTESEPYVEAVLHGWEGLTSRCIDKQGNVYGVCRGSGYSHSALYYKEKLTWQLNDTHGIGIVLLAGIEMLKLSKVLSADVSIV